jgi:hypothetical protein
MQQVLNGENNSSAGPVSASQVVLRRILRIENMGDVWRGNVVSSIRLKGQWLTSAGFHPGERVAVTMVSPGVLEIRLVAEGEADCRSKLPVRDAGTESGQENPLRQVSLAGDAAFDFWVSSHGSLSLFHPQTHKARAWLKAHCPVGNEHQYWCGALAVEARFVPELLGHAAEDGLVVERKEAA